MLVPNLEDSCCVAHAIGMHRHLDDLLFDRKTVTWVAIVAQKGAAGTALLSAEVPWLALTGLAMSDDVGPLTVGAAQHLDDHCASPSCGCFSSSHHGVDQSISTPL